MMAKDLIALFCKGESKLKIARQFIAGDSSPERRISDELDKK